MHDRRVFLEQIHWSLPVFKTCAYEDVRTQTLFKKMAKENPANSRLSVDSGPFVFHYLIHDGICYLTLTDRCSFHPCSMPLRQSNAPSCCGLLHPCMQVAPMERRFHAVDGLLWFVILQSGSSYLKGGSFCFRSYPKKLAYQYLEELQSEFTSLYGTQIQNATRPYAFIKFGARNCLPIRLHVAGT